MSLDDCDRKKRNAFYYCNLRIVVLKAEVIANPGQALL
jgi:hypothetical protein